MSESERLEKRMVDFRERNPKKQFHIGTGYEVVKGPIYHKYCQLCGKNIEEIRQANPRRRLIKFCSDKCKVEYDRRKTIRETLHADGVFWTTYNGEKLPERKTMIATYAREGKDPIQVPIIGRKGSFLIVQI